MVYCMAKFWKFTFLPNCIHGKTTEDQWILYILIAIQFFSFQWQIIGYPHIENKLNSLHSCLLQLKPLPPSSGNTMHVTICMTSILLKQWVQMLCWKGHWILNPNVLKLKSYLGESGKPEDPQMNQLWLQGCILCLSEDQAWFLS